MKQIYQSYEQWRKMVTEVAKLTLTADYCKERIAALQDENDRSTKSLVDAYGTAHRDQMVGYFEQALAEA
jgi:hypothetical protein